MGGLVDGLAGESAVLTSGAVIASFESRDKGCKGGTASCAVEGNERLAVCHCGSGGSMLLTGFRILANCKGLGSRVVKTHVRETVI